MLLDPELCLREEAGEEVAGGGAVVEGTFGMPLHADDEWAAAALGRAFDGFDDAVLAAAGGDAHAVAGNPDGLVVAGVDGQAEKAVAFGCVFRGGDLREQ